VYATRPSSDVSLDQTPVILEVLHFLEHQCNVKRGEMEHWLYVIRIKNYIEDKKAKYELKTMIKYQA
jgi:hypothetical protein